MTDIVNDSAVLAGTEMNRETERPAALNLDQGLPRLLYELAVRLPTQPDIQALCVWLYEPAQQAIRLHVLMADVPGKLRAGMDYLVEDSIAAWVWHHQQPLTISAETEKRFPDFAQALLQGGIKSFCGVPLMVGNRRIGVLGLASAKPGAFSHFKLQSVERDFVNEGDTAAEPPGYQMPADGNREPKYLEAQVRPEDKFEDIIGRSASLRNALDQVKIVAPTDSTVLILGETGTGKELIARAIHNRSSRSEKPFVKINCAANPTGLLESELFGHERGAFTGAIARKTGRFELAHHGTLFLDEIGDIPLELQPKPLRVVQEQEFERLGGTQTTRVDVRLVAATSRNLTRMVESRQFRSDLYYRLNVFPVRLPALRERAELYAKRMHKSVEHIPIEAVRLLARRPWPGNVRELQNFIERAVILSPGKDLRLPLEELNQTADGPDAAAKPVTLKDADREHIIQALADTNWVVGGPKGAAARLGLRRTTMISKMEKLGISRAQA